MQDTRKETGNQGEDRASEYLIEKGYEVLFRNYRTKTGEIDIISLIDETIVFVEVKTLPNGTPELLSHVLDSRKQKRIINILYFPINSYKNLQKSIFHICNLCYTMKYKVINQKKVYFLKIIF